MEMSWERPESRVARVWMLSAHLAAMKAMPVPERAKGGSFIVIPEAKEAQEGEEPSRGQKSWKFMVSGEAD